MQKVVILASNYNQQIYLEEMYLEKRKKTGSSTR